MTFLGEALEEADHVSKRKAAGQSVSYTELMLLALAEEVRRPEIAAALRQSKMIADEPKWCTSGLHTNRGDQEHDAAFARLRKAGEG